MTSVEKQKEYIEGELTSLILSNNDEFSGYTLVESKATTSSQLDGFMSIIFKLNITVQCNETLEKKNRDLIVKLMKGSNDFRTRSKSFIQFGNEVYIYGKVIPAFCKFLENKKTSIEWEKWVPKVYYSFYGVVPALSNIPESVLVLENISPLGFMNPTSRLELDLDHLFLMLKTIAEYHALSYAMRILDEEQLKSLVDGIVPLAFQNDDNEVNLFDVVHGIGLARLFDFLDRRPDVYTGTMRDELEVLRRKYLTCPTKMLDRIREDDYPYSLILHGDYNRNNVLFRYDGTKPVDVRMIDFQEVRYATPVIDLAFFLLMNTSATTRDTHWEELLHFYHRILFKSIVEIVGCDENDERLKPYLFEPFHKHFSRLAIYGVFLTAHFLPWMDCSEEECEKLTYHFETNMQSKEFWDISMIAGGDASNEKILNVVQHASKKGYLRFLLDEK
uniref:Putative juvenile hormone-inducible protein n=1 Tax=Nyssomyia neivai TaxID=330878 RepID=A0A1L8DN30_9DIPT